LYSPPSLKDNTDAHAEGGMADWEQRTRQDYEDKGFANRSGYGQKPALLIVDFINGFTDPSTPLGGDFSTELAATARLLEAFRKVGLPIVFTTITYKPDLSDGGMFVKKVPSLAILQNGSPMVEIDQRIAPWPGEYVLEKKFASSFFGTDLDSYLKGLWVDTVIMAGCTTSGCIRASAIDSLQCGYHSVVVREAVGDRAQGPHEANLFDIDAKYADVVPLEEALGYLATFSRQDGLATRADDAFNAWWNEERKLKA
jgi:nicotinamidase-related amidase